MPGKNLYIADTLSRAPTSTPTQNDSSLEELAELAVESHIAHLPASPNTLDKFTRAQGSDPSLTLIKGYCANGWPDTPATQPRLQPYWAVRGELTLHNNLLLCGGRIVVPESMREQTLKKLHTGHQGIEQCRLRAR